MKSWAVLSFVLVGALGIGFVLTRPYGVIYVDLGEGRGPAAVRRAYDVSELQGLALSKKINERVVGASHLLRRDDAVGIELGQFVTEDSESKKLLACSVYDRIDLVFRAQGVAVNGEVPEMRVSGDCRTNPDDIQMMRPIWVPVNEVLKAPTSLQQFSFHDAEPVNLEFTNVGDDWPKQWVLHSLRLYNSRQPASEVAIDRNEIRMAAPDSIFLEF